MLKTWLEPSLHQRGVASLVAHLDGDAELHSEPGRDSLSQRALAWLSFAKGLMDGRNKVIVRGPIPVFRTHDGASRDYVFPALSHTRRFAAFMWRESVLHVRDRTWGNYFYLPDEVLCLLSARACVC